MSDEMHTLQCIADSPMQAINAARWAVAEIKRLREALERIADWLCERQLREELHATDCPALDDESDSPCDCGLHKIRALVSDLVDKKD